MSKRRSFVIGWAVRVLITLLFFVSATVLIASANGYLFNTTTRRFEHTGIINLTLKQLPVTVNVNGTKKVYKRSPINLSYLLPGYYTVSITKPGYFAWNKSVFVPAGQVLVHPFIKLFLEDGQIKPATLAQREYLERDLLAQESSRALVTDLDVRGTEIWVQPIVRTYPFIDYADHFTLIGRFSRPVKQAIWYYGRSQVVFQIDEDIHIMDRDGSNDHVLVTLQSSDKTDMAIADDGDTLVYRDGDQIFQRKLQ